MKNPAILLVYALLCLHACQKESVTPDPGNEPDESTSLAEAVIGTAGGTLETEDFRLSVPAGAFSSDMSLSLHEQEADVSLEQNQVTSTYLVRGLNQTWNRPLVLEVKYEGELEGESFLTAGYKHVIQESGDTALVYDLLEATDSAGYLKTVLYPLEVPEGGGKSAPAGSVHFHPYVTHDYLIALGLSKMTTYQSDYAEIRYDAGLSDANAAELGKYLDEAVLFFDTQGLIDNLYFMLKKLRVDVVGDPKDQRDLIFVEPATTLPSLEHDGDMFRAYMHLFKVNVSEDYFTRAETRDLRMIAGEAVFRFETYCLFGTERNWLHYALNYWVCEYFYGSVPHTQTIDNLFRQPFLGINADNNPDIIISAFGTRETDQYLHGVGMSSLIQYLMDHHNDDLKLLSRLYLQMINDQGQHSHIDALLECVQTPEYEWWPGFFREYVSGNIWQVPAQQFMDMASSGDVMQFSAASDTVKYFDKNYPDLSSRVCRVNLSKSFSEEVLSDGDKLNFKLGPSSLNMDYVTILLFRFRENTLTFLSEGNDITLDHVKDLAGGEDAAFLAVIVNSASETPYNEDLKIEMTATIERERVWPWKYLSIDAVVTDAVLRSSDDQETLWENFPFEISSKLMERSPDGSGFTTSWLEQNDSYKFEGGIFLSVDTLTYEITDFYFWSNSESLSGGEVTLSERTEIRARDNQTIPVTYWDDDFLRHRITGEEVCMVIETWTYAYRMYPGSANEYSNVLESYSCSENADLDFFWERVESK